METFWVPNVQGVKRRRTLISHKTYSISESEKTCGKIDPQKTPEMKFTLSFNIRSFYY